MPSMEKILPVIALIAILGVIWFLGSGKFGRNQTQAWIDRVKNTPRLFQFLNKHHGKFRAAAHYFEFGGLFLVLFWLQDAILAEGRLVWNPLAAGIIAVISAVGAYLDEVHQLQSGTRQFRREDFLHSCCGICIAAAMMLTQDLIRGVG